MPAEAADYVAKQGLTMPVFADNLNLMQKRYGFEISLKNIWQYRVVGADGRVVANDMSKEAIDRAIEATKPKWKFRGDSDDPKLVPALDQLEQGQYPAGVKLLTPLRKNSNKMVAEAANKVYDELKAEGEKWKEEAEKAAEDEPVKAYDLYSHVTATFPGSDLAKSVADPMKKLAANKTVGAELAARKAFSTVPASLARLTPAQKQLGAKMCQDIAKKHAGTPTGEKAAALAKDLGD
jgi:hypothetical protein